MVRAATTHQPRSLHALAGLRRPLTASAPSSRRPLRSKKSKKSDSFICGCGQACKDAKKRLKEEHKKHEEKKHEEKKL